MLLLLTPWMQLLKPMQKLLLKSLSQVRLQASLIVHELVKSDQSGSRPASLCMPFGSSQSQNVYFNSETSGDSKNVFLPCGDISALHNARTVSAMRPHICVLRFCASSQMLSWPIENVVLSQVSTVRQQQQLAALSVFLMMNHSRLLLLQVDRNQRLYLALRRLGSSWGQTVI